ncbi:MAG TPA: VTT domain-containing protein [Leptolinea sp.]
MNVMVDVIHTFWQNLQIGVITQVGSWNYLIIALLVAIEGPIVTLLGASASASGYLKTGYVMAAAAMGNMTADMVWYRLGYSGKIEWLMPYQRWLGIKPRQMTHLTDEMYKHASKILFFAKLSSGFMIPSLVAAGMAKVPMKKWLPTLLIGEMIWTGVLVFIGYHGTVMLSSISRGIEYVLLGASIIFLVVMVYFIRKALRASGAFEETPDEK